MDKKSEVVELYRERVFTLDYLHPDWTPEGAENIDPTSLHSPDWQYHIHDEVNDSYLSMTEVVATELHNYLKTHISAYVSAITLIIPPLDGDVKLEDITAQLDAAVAQCIAAHALKNSLYCRQLALWLSTTGFRAEGLEINESSTIREIVSKVLGRFYYLCDEYMKYAPGPWREGTFVEALRGEKSPHCLCLHHSYLALTLAYTL